MNKKILSLVIISIVLLAACGKETLDPQTAKDPRVHGHADTAKGEIAPVTLDEKLKQGNIILLDVREADEYEEVHIPGTTLRISSKELSEKALTDAGIKKDDEIVVYCRSGARSKVAAKMMRDLGYSNVWELNSGIIHWLEDGFPGESGDIGLKISGRDGEDAAAAPRIAFDRLSHDFGEVPQFGGKVSTVFKVRNNGSSQLKIGALTTSCSCTEAKVEKNILEAAEETALNVTFNPNLHEEPKEKFKRTIFIPSNDPENSEAEITIEVDILEGK